MSRIPTPFFRFKQFTVWHDRTALRVCTEACILGAYADPREATHALDIGTGTGLLALMLAQRNSTMHIDALEIERENYLQAAENIKQSPFAERIDVHQSAIQDWVKKNSLSDVKQYDLIISNPPFFDNHLLSPHKNRNLALHTETLSLSDLAASIDSLLAANGRFVVLLPPNQTHVLSDLLGQVELWPSSQLQIFPRADKALFRQITTFERTKKGFSNETLYIHDPNGSYSQDFQILMKDYYLIF